jgi:hypothetical protein
VAAFAGRLAAELPIMTMAGNVPEVVPSDQMVDAALRLARLWRRLAEHRTSAPGVPLPMSRPVGRHGKLTP